MTKYETEQDKELEKEIYKKVKRVSKYISGLNVKQTTGFSHFDFLGPEHGVEIKVRSYYSEKFDFIPVTPNKIQFIKDYPHRIYYIVYYFKQNRIIRVYHLSPDLELTDWEFTHRRSGEKIKKKVYKLPIRDFLEEFIDVY